MARQKLTPKQRKDAIAKLRAGDAIKTVADEVDAPRSAVAKTKERKVRTAATMTTEGKSVACRLSPVEVEALEKLKARHGYTSNSDVLRALVRASSGLLEFDEAAAQKLEEIRSELRKIGVNVNQVALAANRGRLDLVKHHWTAINDLRQALPGLRTYLQAVVDEQRRRGMRLFEKFMGAERG